MKKVDKIANKAMKKTLKMNKRTKKAPLVLLGVSILAGVGACAYAVHVGTKLEELKEDHYERMDKANTTPMQEADRPKAKAEVVAQTCGLFLKMSWPMLALELVSIGGSVMAVRDLRKSYQIAAAASIASAQALAAMKERIIAEEGEEKYRHYRFGTMPVNAVDEDKKVVDTIETTNGFEKPNLYTRYFTPESAQYPNRGDDMDVEWHIDCIRRSISSTWEHSKERIMCLNTIYSAFDVPKSKYGQYQGISQYIDPMASPMELITWYRVFDPEELEFVIEQHHLDAIPKMANKVRNGQYPIYRLEFDGVYDIISESPWPDI